MNDAASAIQRFSSRSGRLRYVLLKDSLAGGEWVKQHQNVLLIGSTGLGKTWLACALAQKACRDGHTVLHKRAAELFREFSVAHVDGSFGRMLIRLSRIDILVLDDFAMAPLKDAERRDFLELWALPSVAISSAQVAPVWHRYSRISKPLKKKYLLACLPARYKYSCPDLLSIGRF